MKEVKTKKKDNETIPIVIKVRTAKSLRSISRYDSISYDDIINDLIRAYKKDDMMDIRSF